jgi:hypothetical protein
MRFPWQHRAEKEHDLRLVAEQRLATARSNWPLVREHADSLRRERELNGWTGIVAALFEQKR